MSPAREHWAKQDGRDAVRPLTPLKKPNSEESMGEGGREEEKKGEVEEEEEGDEVRKKESREG